MNRLITLAVVLPLTACGVANYQKIKGSPEQTEIDRTICQKEAAAKSTDLEDSIGATMLSGRLELKCMEKKGYYIF